MAEPISTTSASATLAAIGVLSLFPGVPAESVLGAFAGAAVFILSSQELTLVRKALFFCVSFVSGILAASTASGLMASALPKAVSVSPGVGAMVSAAVIVRLLQWMIRRANDPDGALKEWRG